ncbi:MAG: hypothetical protein M4D80_22030 [Myxococcota bacterium]|nr:hypothetical protein [Myxococcota bacterium]
MLADRARTPLIVAAVVSAGLAAVTLWPCEAPPPVAAAIHVSTVPPASGTSIEISDFCPSHVRAAMHLGNDATLYCVRGEYPEPGTFVFAQYRTTESWERFAVVGDDGKLIVPMLDRPRSQH